MIIIRYRTIKTISKKNKVRGQTTQGKGIKVFLTNIAETEYPSEKKIISILCHHSFHKNELKMDHRLKPRISKFL